MKFGKKGIINPQTITFNRPVKTLVQGDFKGYTVYSLSNMFCPITKIESRNALE